MKKVKFYNKLSLNKTLIVKLNSIDSTKIHGGARITIFTICVKTALDTYCLCSKNGDIRCETKHDFCASNIACTDDKTCAKPTEI